MKILFLILLLITFAAVGQAQIKEPSVGFHISEKVVKAAPFSAESISESIQVLADGNRIIRRSTGRLYRDNEGRFRREDMPKQIGVPGAVIDVPESILIIDPVAGYKYVLNPKNNTARQSALKMPFDFRQRLTLELKLKMETKRAERLEKQAERKAKAVERKISRVAGEGADTEAKAAAKKAVEAQKATAAEQAKVAKEAAKQIRVQSDYLVTAKKDLEKQVKSNAKTESLGVQNIEGIDADGTRTTTTIPAGAIGNEREIDIVYEKWYSKDLQMTVFSKHNDPRFGEQTYRLTNISRSEPSITLFSPPADYKIIEDKRPQPKPVPMPKPPSSDKKPPSAPASPSEPKKPSN